MTELNGIRAAVFRPLPDALRADAIVERLTTAIALGLIRQGEQLPIETQLMSKFGVASATVRDALRTLRAIGIIDTRRGRTGGTFVVGMPVFDTAGLHQRLIELSMAELRDLADEQIAIAVAAIRLAHDRAFPSEISRLKTLARSLASADSAAACSRADSRFHIEISVVAQSERLTKSEIRLQSETVEMLWSTLSTDEDRLRSTAEHLALAEALDAEDSGLAEQLAIDHIQRNIYKVTEKKMALTYPDSGAN